MSWIQPVLFIALILCLSACTDSKHKTDDALIERYIKIKDRSCINIEDSFDIKWRYGTPEMKVTGVHEDVNHVQVNYTQDCLYISLKYDENHKRPERMPLFITTSDLNYFSATHLSKFDIQLMEEEKFSIQLSGKAHGQLKGMVGELFIYLHDQAQLMAKQLEVDQANVYATGQTTLSVNAKERLEVRSSGKAIIRFMGDPVISKAISADTTLERLQP